MTELHDRFDWQMFDSASQHRHTMRCYWDLMQCSWVCPPVPSVVAETPAADVAAAAVPSAAVPGAAPAVDPAEALVTAPAR